MSTFNIAIVGATGAVGTTILEKLLERKFPAKSIKLLASKRSVGLEITSGNRKFIVKEATPESFDDVDIAFFSAGGSISKMLAEEATDRGAVVIDNTSAFRMDENIPLVVPEVNAHVISDETKLIANPNCSTIQMVAALKPIREKYGLNRIIVSTYQAVSGAGVEAIDELQTQAGQFEERAEIEAEVLPSASAERHYPIAYNVIPQIDAFDDSGYTLEELKMMNETKKIFEAPDMEVSATCVRVPVVTGHSESLYIELEKENVTTADLKEVLTGVEGLVLQDDPSTQSYPMAIYAEGKDEIFVGRIRKDPDHACGFHLWVVTDNLVKGAALNSVQIAEHLAQLKTT